MKIKRCKICGNIQLEKITWKKLTWKYTRAVILGFIFFTSLVGITGLYNFFQVEGWKDQTSSFNAVGQSYSFLYNFGSKFQLGEKKEILEEIANNLTNGCEDMDEYCKVKRIFGELSTFDYLEENATNLDPINTWNTRKGDCDQMSMLLKTLLDKLDKDNIDSMMSCDIEHCWVVINLKNPEKMIIADLTKSRWIEE